MTWPIPEIPVDPDSERPPILKPPWPTETARNVSDHATVVQHRDALSTLALIRDGLFGDLDRVDELATAWGLSTAMTGPADDVTAARTNLAAYWSGSAYNAYSLYAGEVVSRLGGNESVMNAVASVLGQTITTVYKTYSTALKYIADCSNTLGNFTINVATGAVGGPAVMGVKAALEIFPALNKFVTDTTKLYADMIAVAGEYQSMGLALKVGADNFKEPQAIPAAAGQPGQWQVAQNPDPTPMD